VVQEAAMVEQLGLALVDLVEEKVEILVVAQDLEHQGKVSLEEL
jgi:hypothetical protein